MSDFEKVYTIKFETKSAEKSLQGLEKILLRLEKSGVYKKIKEFNKTLIEVNKSAKKTGDTIKKNLGKQAKKDIENLGRAGKTASKGLDEIPKAAKRVNISLTTIGRTLNRYVLAPLAAVSALSIKAAFDINQGMANVGTLIPGQTERLQELKRGLQDVAVEAGTATGDMTEGAYAAISAWGDGADTLDRLRVVAKAAKAGLASTSDTLALFTSITEIFGDNSSKAVEHLSDLAFTTNKLAIKAPFSAMASSMGSVAPLAKQIGVSVEDMFATMTAQAGVTGTVSEVSTQMAGLYTSIIKQTPRMTAVVKAMNKELGTGFKSAEEAIGNLGTLPFLQQLTKHTKGTTDLSKALGGRKEGMILALSLVNSRAEKYNEALHVMQTESGATQVAFKEQTEGINKQGFQFEQTKQRMIVFAQRLGDRLLPVLVRLMDAAEPILLWLENMDKEQIDAAISMGKMAGQFVIFVNALRGIMAISSGVQTFLAATNIELGSYSKNASTAATKTKGLTTALSGLQKGVALLGMLALGYTIGDLINTGILEPSRKKEERGRASKVKLATETTLGAERIKDENLFDRREKLKKEYSDFLESTRTEDNPLFRGVLGKKLKENVTGGAETAEQERIKKALLEAIGTVEEEIDFRRTGLQAIRGKSEFDPNAVSLAQKRQRSVDVGLEQEVRNQKSILESGPYFDGSGGGSVINVQPQFNIKSSPTQERAQRLIERGMKAMAEQLEREGNAVNRK